MDKTGCQALKILGIFEGTSSLIIIHLIDFTKNLSGGRYTVLKLQKFALTLFWQKSLERHLFTLLLVRVNFSFYHTVTEKS